MRASASRGNPYWIGSRPPPSHGSNLPSASSRADGALQVVRARVRSIHVGVRGALRASIRLSETCGVPRGPQVPGLRSARGRLRPYPLPLMPGEHLLAFSCQTRNFCPRPAVPMNASRQFSARPSMTGVRGSALSRRFRHSGASPPTFIHMSMRSSLRGHSMSGLTVAWNSSACHGGIARR